MRRPEEGKPDRDPVIDHTLPEHVDGAAPVEFFGQSLTERLLSLIRTAVQLDELVPLLLLRRPDEGQRRPEVETRLAIELEMLDLLVPAMLDQPSDDLRLERLLVNLHPATPGMSSCPVTAAVINAR